MNRFTEKMKLYLFDLAHENLNEDEILKGFIKHYVLHNCTMDDIQDDIVFHTSYGEEGVIKAMSSVRRILNDFVSK